MTAVLNAPSFVDTPEKLTDYMKLSPKSQRLLHSRAEKLAGLTYDQIRDYSEVRKPQSEWDERTYSENLSTPPSVLFYISLTTTDYDCLCSLVNHPHTPEEAIWEIVERDNTDHILWEVLSVHNSARFTFKLWIDHDLSNDPAFRSHIEERLAISPDLPYEWRELLIDAEIANRISEWKL